MNPQIIHASKVKVIFSKMELASEFMRAQDRQIFSAWSNLLAEMRFNPFDRKPLHYDKKQRRLWSASKSLTEEKRPLPDLVQMIVE